MLAHSSSTIIVKRKALTKYYAKILGQPIL